MKWGKLAALGVGTALAVTSTGLVAQEMGRVEAALGDVEWRHIGPVNMGGRVSAIVGTPGDPKTFWVGGADGGVWRTSNGGVTFEGQWQVALLTDYMHGRLSPMFTVAAFTRGTYFVNPAITYRWSDSLIFDVNYVHIGGAYVGAGFFRDRDQISFRATFQLN